MDLKPGQDNHVLLDFSGFTDETDYLIGLRVFAENLAEPARREWTIRVARGRLPELL